MNNSIFLLRRRFEWLNLPVLMWVLIVGCISAASASGAATSAASPGNANTTGPGAGYGPITTFSIVAHDPETGDYGVAVQSKYFAVGDVVPFAAADTGALATQARGNILHGPEGLELLAEGVPAEAVIRRLIDKDPLGEGRQLGVIDANGQPATYTGSDCLPWAGGKTGSHYAVQGNLLAGPQVIEAMAATFEAAPGDLATRLVYALAAGLAAGGDARGRQSAAVLVVRKGAGYLGLTDRHIDLHVEDHPTPIRELKRLLDIRHAQLAAVRSQNLLEKAKQAGPKERSGLVKEAREAAELGVGFSRDDDHLWWLVAQTRWLDGDFEAAVDAGQVALLLSPSWPRLPEQTRVELGLPPELVSALRQDQAFRRLWDSLAVTGSAQ
jgi:uncharacterized Ntn-hydrolase superfamily protein